MKKKERYFQDSIKDNEIMILRKEIESLREELEENKKNKIKGIDIQIYKVISLVKE